MESNDKDKNSTCIHINRRRPTLINGYFEWNTCINALINIYKY